MIQVFFNFVVKVWVKTSPCGARNEFFESSSEFWVDSGGVELCSTVIDNIYFKLHFLHSEGKFVSPLFFTRL